MNFMNDITILKDKDGVPREIPMSSLMGGGFRLFGLSISQINELRYYYKSKENKEPFEL